MGKVCFITGSRADYDLLKPLMTKITNDPTFEFQLAVTGTHLDSRFGHTYENIAADGFRADALVDLKLGDDSSLSVGRALGLAVIGFTENLNRLRPDLLIVLGDRYEILAAVQAALILKIPVAHLYGGDVTEGAFDDAIRHSISKMSHLHFVSNQPAAQRLKAMGEDPNFIFNVGAPNLDVIEGLHWLSKDELEKVLSFKFQKRNLLVTFHPETLAANSLIMFQELTYVLKKYYGDYGIVFTKSNADPEGQSINTMIDEFVKVNSRAVAFSSLGSQRYLSIMKITDAVVGNSSSGIYEAPTLKRPTVNIGDRQKGRLMASSIVNCRGEREQIRQALEQALNLDCRDVQSPYGVPGATLRILGHLKEISDYKSLL